MLMLRTTRLRLAFVLNNGSEQRQFITDLDNLRKLTVVFDDHDLTLNFNGCLTTVVRRVRGVYAGRNTAKHVI